jgi:hypothetical protein
MHRLLEYFRWEQWVLFCGAALIFSMCYRYHLTIKLKDSRK